MTNLVKIDAGEFGLSDDSAKLVQSAFTPMIEKLTDLENQFNEIVSQEISEPLTKTAKDLRLQYTKIRTGVDKIHKEQKAFYLNGGRFVDGWKNAAKFAIGEKENRLKSIEDYYENLEKERLEKLKIDRIEKLKSLSDEFEIVIPEKIELMSDVVFDSFFSGESSRIENLKKEIAEKERLEKELLEKERIYNERYKVLAKYADFIDLDELTIDSTREEAAEIKSRAEKLYAEFQEQQKKIEAENERLKREAENERFEREKAEKERIEKERIERLEREKAERAKIEESKRLERERIEAEHLAKEKAIRDEKEKKLSALADRILAASGDKSAIVEILRELI